jgi:maltose O-acetyltransferase
VGTRAMILPGVTLGTGAVVAAGAVVTKNIEPYTVAGGVPARTIGKRNAALEYEVSYRRFYQ